MKRLLSVLLAAAHTACGDAPTAVTPGDAALGVPTPALTLIAGAIYECAQPATATASSFSWFPSYDESAYAIDCNDTSGQWNSGGTENAFIQVDFAAPRTLSGVHLSVNALPAAVETYIVYGKDVWPRSGSGSPTWSPPCRASPPRGSPSTRSGSSSRATPTATVSSTPTMPTPSRT
ncbi:MAG: hypothetical protein AMXMBFR53_03080 [Gemmatimonadota bacterium]